MSQKEDIRHRMSMIGEQTKFTAVERSRKLKSLQVTENKLEYRKRELRKQRDLINKDIDECVEHLNRIAIEKRHIDQVKHPIITEHAFLRYLERFCGVDLNVIHDQILKLEDKHIVRSGMTIVTVFTDDDDHINLAEREKI